MKKVGFSDLAMSTWKLPENIHDISFKFQRLFKVQRIKNVIFYSNCCVMYSYNKSFEYIMTLCSTYARVETTNRKTGKKLPDRFYNY